MEVASDSAGNGSCSWWWESRLQELSLIQCHSLSVYFFKSWEVKLGPWEARHVIFMVCGRHHKGLISSSCSLAAVFGAAASDVHRWSDTANLSQLQTVFSLLSPFQLLSPHLWLESPSSHEFILYPPTTSISKAIHEKSFLRFCRV